MWIQNILIMISSVFHQIEDGGSIEFPDIVDFASGVFAIFLMSLSLLAFRNTKAKRLILVATAFGLFAIRAIVTRLDAFIPESQSTVIETALALMGFAFLSLFFMAIVKRQ